MPGVVVLSNCPSQTTGVKEAFDLPSSQGHVGAGRNVLGAGQKQVFTLSLRPSARVKKVKNGQRKKFPALESPPGQVRRLPAASKALPSLSAHGCTACPTVGAGQRLPQGTSAGFVSFNQAAFSCSRTCSIVGASQRVPAGTSAGFASFSQTASRRELAGSSRLAASKLGLGSARDRPRRHAIGREPEAETSPLADENGGSTSPSSADVAPADLAVEIEAVGSNTRRVTAQIRISTPLETIWGVLTDYPNLGDFIPSLAVNELLERRPNGARLLQVGQQDLALGLKFKARAVMEVEERPMRDFPGGRQRSIEFTMVEGDFQLFRGTWQMEESTTCAGAESGAGPPSSTVLSYSVEVTPQGWLPVALVEGRLANDICTNLACVRQHAQSRVSSARSAQQAPNGVSIT